MGRKRRTTKRYMIGTDINAYHGNSQKEMIDRIVRLKNMMKVRSTSELIKLLIVCADNWIYPSQKIICECHLCNQIRNSQNQEKIQNDSLKV